MRWRRAIEQRWPGQWPLRPLTAGQWSAQRSTYRDADPVLIEAAAKRAAARPSGNWFVAGASRDVRRDRPFAADVAGTELVAWRDAAGELVVGPGACPHLGAPLAQARVGCGELICRWHGLRIGPGGAPGWSPLLSYDDGVLFWVRLDHVGGESPTGRPVVDRRDHGARIDAVTASVGRCEPYDILANRLDPWHGAWFHPYSFAQLRVLQSPRAIDVPAEEDRFLVEVTFRVAPGLGVPVRAEFTCPEPRTVVMRIVSGEGVGSVVETHATPLRPGPDGSPRTAVIEAIVAQSDRRGFRVASAVAPLLRPAIRANARRLWRDDLAYAQRRYDLRSRGT